jgi:ABC-2 type transport system ATP-binding protein
MSTVIDVQSVSKRFVIRKEKSLKERIVNFGRSNRHKEDFWALRDVDLAVEAGTTVGLVGPNGSGKSTLLKTIGGIIQPTRGNVFLRGRLAALLELGAGFHPDLTGRENVYLNASILGLSRAFVDKHLDAIIDFSGIEQFIDTQVKFYSSGMYVRLAFAVSVHVDPDILLVDEVLAVGDEAFQRKCLERIRTFQKEGRTIVLVSHGLEQVAEFCDRVVVLDHGNVVADGPANDSLMVLRAEFEHQRLDDVAKRAQHSDASDDSARFVGVVARDRNKVEDHPIIDSGDPLRIVMAVEADQDLTDPVLEVAVCTPLGNPLFTTSSEMLGHTVQMSRGRHQYVFDLTDVPLGAGEYTVRTSLRSASGSELHHVPIAASFGVRNNEASRGPLTIPTTFHEA